MGWYIDEGPADKMGVIDMSITIARSNGESIRVRVSQVIRNGRQIGYRVITGGCSFFYSVGTPNEALRRWAEGTRRGW